MNSSDLIRCPFCGSVAKIREFYLVDTLYDVLCENPKCGCQIEKCESKLRAISRWNTRYTEPPVPCAKTMHPMR